MENNYSDRMDRQRPEHRPLTEIVHNPEVFQQFELFPQLCETIENYTGLERESVETVTQFLHLITEVWKDTTIPFTQRKKTVYGELEVLSQHLQEILPPEVFVSTTKNLPHEVVLSYDPRPQPAEVRNHDGKLTGYLHPEDDRPQQILIGRDTLSFLCPQAEIKYSWEEDGSFHIYVNLSPQTDLGFGSPLFVCNYFPDGQGDYGYGNSYFSLRRGEATEHPDLTGPEKPTYFGTFMSSPKLGSDAYYNGKGQLEWFFVRARISGQKQNLKYIKDPETQEFVPFVKDGHESQPLEWKTRGLTVETAKNELLLSFNDEVHQYPLTLRVQEFPEKIVGLLNEHFPTVE